jgi:hypothetical protein
MFEKILSKENFNPLIFLMSLGAGGISVIPFAFLQYTFEHPAGLVQYVHIDHGALSLEQMILFRGLELMMVLFAAIHLILSAIMLPKLISWIRSPRYHELMADPLKNAAIVAPFISAIMTMNVFIGPVRFFVPWFADNLQMFMLPALIFWAGLWVWLLKVEFKLLKSTFEKSFDVNKISFGWLLHPFALGMLTVTGTGIAAMSKDVGVAHTAAFMSIISGSMGFFLLLVKLNAIFKSHFAQTSLPDKQFMPSFLIVIPNITLYAISVYRLGHYFDVQFDAHLHALVVVFMTLAFAFETWYMMFGLSMMSDYFKKHFFNKEFYITQWGLVCPFVAYAVLASFVFATFLTSPVFYGLAIVFAIISAVLFFVLFNRQMRCAGVIRDVNMSCS